MPAKKPRSRTKDEGGSTEGERREGSERARNVREPIMEFASATSDVVREAAAILEEEIAAGIVAAKRVEEEFVKPEELRTGRDDEVTHRLRRDAHEAVDILMDVLVAASRAAGRAGTAARGETQPKARSRSTRRGRGK